MLNVDPRAGAGHVYNDYLEMSTLEHVLKNVYMPFLARVPAGGQCARLLRYDFSHHA